MALKEDRTEKPTKSFGTTASLDGWQADERDDSISMHVLGASVRWDKELPRAIGEMHAQEFCDALIALGI